MHYLKRSPEKPAAYSAKLTPISQIEANLSSYFTDIKDPRVKRTKKHLLKDILVIAILAIIALEPKVGKTSKIMVMPSKSGCQNLRELPHGIPSDDTFRRLFERIDPIALCECLTKWVQQLIPSRLTKNCANRWQVFEGFL